LTLASFGSQIFADNLTPSDISIHMCGITSKLLSRDLTSSEELIFVSNKVVTLFTDLDHEILCACLPASIQQGWEIFADKFHNDTA
ncbi:MAG: hypothetical protein VX113_06880, partial [Pseudomonadota bacterium]|nr:hypothetical protein [Pseudomonadota bacterium]